MITRPLTPSIRLLSLLLLLPLGGCFGGSSKDEINMSSPASGMVRLAGQMRDSGDIVGAIDFYQRAIQRSPKEMPAYLELGALLEKNNDFNNAAACYRAGLDHNPHDPELLRRYARVLMSLGQTSDARDHYKRALKKAPDDTKIMNGLAIALDRLGSHDEAQKMYLKALDAEPENLNTLNNLAYSHILSERYKEAVQLLEPVHLDKKASAALRQNLALAYGLSGMDMDAERVSRIDLLPEQVKENLDYYRRKRAEKAVTTEPYIDLGSYATQALAEVQIERLRKLGFGAETAPVIAPEVSAPGGTPRFTLHLTGCQKQDDLNEVCKDLIAEGFPCTVREPTP